MNVVEVAALRDQSFRPLLQQSLKIHQVVVAFSVLLAKRNEITQCSIRVQVQRCVFGALLLVVKGSEVALDVEALV